MSQGWIQTETLFPYGAAIALSSEAVTTNDLQIQKTYPGVEYFGTEPNAVYQESREITGDFWMATNATYAPAAPATPNQWTQVNTALQSYATVFRVNGSIQRLTASAGSSAPITWTTLWMIDASGAESLTPTPFLSSSEIAISTTPTWDAPGQVMTAFQIAITDTASATASLLENFSVGGTSVWAINKAGQLVNGSIGGSLVIPNFTTAVNANSSVIGASSGQGFNVGTANVDTAYALTWGAANTVAPYHLASIGSFSTTAINAVYGNVALIRAVGSGSGVAIDQNGNMGMSGGLYAASLNAVNASLTNALNVNGFTIIGGQGNVGTGFLGVSGLATYSTVTGQAYGDGVFQRTASTGAIALGGSSSAGFIDFGITNTGAFTISTVYSTYTGVIYSAGMIARQGGISATALTTLSNPGFSAGDLAAQRTASTGVLFLGGATSYGYLDYGVTVGGVFSMNKVLYAPQLASYAGQASAAYCAPVFNSSGGALGAACRVYVGIASLAYNGSSGGTTTITLPAAYTSNTSYFTLTNMSSLSSSVGFWCSAINNSSSTFTIDVGGNSTATINPVYVTWITIGS